MSVVHGRCSPLNGSRLGSVLALVLLGAALAACGGKTETQLANDALNAGIAAQTGGNVAEAQKQYNECLKHDPTSKACHYDLGLIAQTQGDLTTAENQYRLSLSTDPNYTPALFNLAIARTQLADTTEAIALYRRYVQLLPKDAGGHLNLGLLLTSTGAKGEGQKEIATAIQLDPTITVPASSTPSSTPSQAAKPSPSK